MKDKKISSLPDMSQLELEASEWVIRLDKDDVSAAELAEFESWRRQSSLHHTAYIRMSGFWNQLDFAEKLNDYAQSDVAAESMRLDRLAHSSSLYRYVVTGSIAACLLGFIAVFNYTSLFNQNQIFNGAYKTVVGKQEVINLPDGSQITLNTDSVVDIVYTKGTRKIHLLKGEAYFDVAHNTKRPFSVETPKGTVTAVGTAFSVRVSDKQLDVLVAEGRIALDAAKTDTEKSIAFSAAKQSTEKRSPVEVSAGQSVIVDQEGENISFVAQSILDKKLDWKDGELSFNGETLAQVVVEISRYTNISIEIRDENLKQQQIVAYYKIGDVERMFEALNVMANIEVERLDDRHVRLYRANKLRID